MSRTVRPVLEEQATIGALKIIAARDGKPCPTHREIMDWTGVQRRQSGASSRSHRPRTRANGCGSSSSPWLIEECPRPAVPGELRWFAANEGKNIEVEIRGPFKQAGELITAQSRAFVPSRMADNPYLMSTCYAVTLQPLPEPLRSQMLGGTPHSGPTGGGIAAKAAAGAGRPVTGGRKGTPHGHVVVVAGGALASGKYPPVHGGNLKGGGRKDTTTKYAWVAPDRDEVVYYSHNA